MKNTSWNPLAKLVYINRRGKRRFQVTRLAAAVLNAKRAEQAGATEISVTVDGKLWDWKS